MTLAEAIERYVALRRELERLMALEDAAFARYFAKRQAGEPTNGAAVSRLANRVNYLSADLESASGPLWDADLDPEKVWLEATGAASAK